LGDDFLLQDIEGDGHLAGIEELDALDEGIDDPGIGVAVAAYEDGIEEVIVIPIKQIGTHVLSGVDTRPVKVKTKHLYKSTTRAVCPRRFKHLIKKCEPPAQKLASRSSVRIS